MVCIWELRAIIVYDNGRQKRLDSFFFVASNIQSDLTILNIKQMLHHRTISRLLHHVERSSSSRPSAYQVWRTFKPA